MAILPSIDNNTRKRELTDKQEAFLTHLVETQGDAREAAKLAGYSSHYHHVVKTLKSEILELTQEVLANSAPKAAFKQGSDWLVIGRDITKGNIKNNLKNLSDHLSQ